MSILLNVHLNQVGREITDFFGHNYIYNIDTKTNRLPYLLMLVDPSCAFRQGNIFT